MRKTFWIYSAAAMLVAGAIGLSAQGSAAAKPTAVVYKTSSCGCCKLWVEHLKANGFTVEAKDVSADEVRAVSKAAGLKDDDTSCHTAKIGGYIVEGHVPASDIQRMLKEKPAIAGIAAPGMPQGSPGMEQGSKEPFDVVAFTKDGKTKLYAKH
jgi:hypothetical protein